MLSYFQRRLLSSSRKRVVVAMSGGIDSSVAALLLKNQGYECIGVFMRNWDNSDEFGREVCPIEVDRADMQEVCRRLNIPSHDVNFVRQYWNEVFSPFIEAYRSGKETPNPDVFCNKHIKFKYFLDYVRRQFDTNLVATGHYARLLHSTAPDEQPSCSSRKPQLLRAVDPSKDQSYFLCMTPGDKLKDIIFPLGNLTKARVKEIAADHFAGLSVLRKRESVGLCFIGERDMPSFLTEYFTPTPGRFIDIDTGLPMGTHKGKELFTNGQKARISGAPHKYFVVAHLGSTFRPKYMTNKINNNDILLPGDLYVACGREHFALYSDYAVLDSDSTSWVTGSMPADLQEKYKIALQKHNRSRSSTSCSDRDNDSIGLVDSENTECDIDLLSEFPYTVQHGHLETPVPCTISFRFHTPSIADTKSSPGCDVVIKMRRPEWAICPGQVAAIYAGSVCLGGGKVKSFGNSNDSFVELQ